ncbi:protein tweety homolog 1-A-like isoform X2 [Acanthaster planci]|uniref:Protein tweety homolog n=1 Tax=Acanthaster planci TaxID=133434 RepID=A0A8B7YGU6_ACAPL|nr:protein tweety homolog 1-A-like isoform X2 [Acanthaster planci]
MWHLVNNKYSDEFVPSWLTEFFHSWPHVSYRGFEKYSSTFNPEDPKYIQTLIFWGAIPVLWLLASLLFVILYGTCHCCKNRKRRAHPAPNRQKKTQCLKWMIITLALLSAAFVGGGLYGNETTATGVQHLVQSAQDVNSTIDTTEKEITTIYNGITVDLKDKVDSLEKIFQEPIANLTRQRMLQEETQALQSMVGCAGKNVSQIDAAYSNNLDLSRPTTEVQYYETIRWGGFIGVFCFELIICLVVLCGACTGKRCSLISSAILCVIGMVIVWCLAAAETFVTLGVSDFCADPDTFIFKQAKMSTDLTDEFLKYYMKCGQTASPFSKDLSSANTDLALAGTTLDKIASLSKGFYPRAEPVVAQAKTALNSVTTSVLTLSGNLDCATSGVHKDYITSLHSVCYDSVIGITIMLLSAMLAGLLFTLVILCTINLNGRLPKRKIPYAVDQEDPFLPPNDNTATLERYRRNMDPPSPRQDNRPAPLPSDHRARPISLSSSLQGYSHEQGLSSSNQAWPVPRQQGTSSGWGGATGAGPSTSSNQPPVRHEGYDSPPPSYTLAMSRDNQRRNAENGQHQQQARLSSGSIV